MLWLKKCWFPLSPKDADAHNEGVIDPQAFLELSCPVRRRIRAKRALVRVEQRFGNQLVEFERNMAERAWQEVGASERSIEFLCRCARQCLARIDRETTRPCCSNLSLLVRERQDFVCVSCALVLTVRPHMRRNRKWVLQDDIQEVVWRTILPWPTSSIPQVGDAQQVRRVETPQQSCEVSAQEG